MPARGHEISPPPLSHLDPQNLKLACDLSTTAARLRPLRFPSSVWKHRSLADAQRLRRSWGA
jgi:hypothetical protein